MACVTAPVALLVAYTTGGSGSTREPAQSFGAIEHWPLTTAPRPAR